MNFQSVNYPDQDQIFFDVFAVLLLQLQVETVVVIFLVLYNLLHN